MSKTSFANPSEFALAVGGLSYEQQSVRHAFTGATTGTQSVGVVGERGRIVNFRLQMATVGAASTTTPNVVQLRKQSAGSLTPVTLASISYSAAMAMVRGQPTSSTSIAAMSVSPGDLVMLRYTATGGSTTSSPLAGYAQVEVVREFD